LNQDIGTSARRGKAPSHRQLRVGEELRHALSRILARGELRDPSLADLNLTVTEVRLSPDLKNATAFVVPLGGSGLEAAVAALNRAGGFFRSRLAQEVALRHAPRVAFAPDRSFDEARRVDEILERPRVRRDLVAGSRAADSGAADSGAADSGAADSGAADSGAGAPGPDETESDEVGDDHGA
jgi:ribosome-binding factor A